MVWKDDLLWGNQSKTQAMMWVAKDKNDVAANKSRLDGVREVRTSPSLDRLLLAEQSPTCRNGHKSVTKL